MTGYSDAEKALYGLYCQTLNRFEAALKITKGLHDRDRIVAGLMLEFANYGVYRDSGAIVCWVGVQTLAECDEEAVLKARASGKKVNRSRVQRAQKTLRDLGIITVQEEGGGRTRSTVHAFSLEWLERVTADAERWAPAAMRLKLRPPQGATLSMKNSRAGATLSTGQAEAVGTIGGSSATGSPQGATVSARNGRTSATLFGSSATDFGQNGRGAATVSEESATVSPEGATLSAWNGRTDATLSGGRATDAAKAQEENGAGTPNGSVDATVSGGIQCHISGKGSSSAQKTVAPVRPENKDLKINTQRRPFQPPLLLPMAGGKPVGAAVRDAQTQARAVAMIEADGRFDKLRQEATKLMGGDVGAANLAIACMDDRIKRGILRGNWPSSLELHRVLHEGLTKTQERLPPLGATNPDGAGLSRAAAEQPIPGANASPAIREDRIERLAVQAAQQAGDAVQSVQALRDELAEIKGLLRLLAGQSGQESAVA